MGWHYRVKAPNEKVRDPIQGEFFSTEAIKNPADARVREAIQNALDAALKDGNGHPMRRRNYSALNIARGTARMLLEIKEIQLAF